MRRRSLPAPRARRGCRPRRAGPPPPQRRDRRRAPCGACAQSPRPSGLRAPSRATARGGGSRARVEQRGRLVEDERVRVREDEPGERELLRLRRRERPSAGSDHRLEPVRQRLRPPERIDRAERLAQLLVRGAGPREPQVLRDGADEACCSWVTSATSFRSVSSGRSTSRTPPTSTRPTRGGWMPASRRPRWTFLRPRARPRRLALQARGRGRSHAGRPGRRCTRSARLARSDRRPRARRRSPCGPAAPRAIPTRRANDVAPTWISSSHETSRSTGSASCTT